MEQTPALNSAGKQFIIGCFFHYYININRSQAIYCVKVIISHWTLFLFKGVCSIQHT